MNAILALAGKDLKILLRDKAAFFFTFGFPLVYAIFFGTIFASVSSGRDGGGSKLPIAVVDEDRTAQSAAFLKTLREAPEFDVAEADRAAALEQVQRGKRSAAVVMPAGFGASRGGIFSGTPPVLQIATDPSRAAEAGMLQGVLTKYMVQDLQRAFTDTTLMRGQIQRALDRTREIPEEAGTTRGTLERFLGELDRFVTQMPAFDEGVSDRENSNGAAAKPGETPSAAKPATQAVAAGRRGGFAGFEPVRIEKLDVQRKKRGGPTNAYAISFPQGIVWAVMGAAAAFGISLVIERQRGTLRRLLVSPLTLTAVLAGKALACFGTIVAVILFLLALATLGFGVRPTSWPLLGAAVLSIAIAFVGIMMVLSVLGRTEQSAGGIGWAVLTLMAMIGGGMLPYFMMPPWMQSAASVSPIKWSILALEGALWRDFTPAMMAEPCLILVAIGIGCFALGVRVFAWSRG